ncbi:MAG: Phosphoesterase PA-phosphatase related protein [Candidatus Beckwithbacteria bacterium GW2011_GWA2_47_25]|nr:MAG: Phosphoesterase PA-phosphatase related protein [Candidatus Beckwithbacteria bacterium GW2011_GWA2_47_25]
MQRVLLIISFLILAVFAKQYSYFSVDLQVSQALQTIHNSLFSDTMNLVSEIGDDYHLVIIIGLVVALLFFVGLKLEALKIALFSLTGALVGTFVKKIVSRPRPDFGLVKIQAVMSDKSFPSLHVLLFTIFFGYLFYLSIYKIKTRWLKILIASVSAFLILAIGLSRIYLGAHWASDVLGGYLLGAIFISLLKNHA